MADRYFIEPDDAREAQDGADGAAEWDAMQARGDADAQDASQDDGEPCPKVPCPSCGRYGECAEDCPQAAADWQDHFYSESDGA